MTDFKFKEGDVIKFKPPFNNAIRYTVTKQYRSNKRGNYYIAEYPGADPWLANEDMIEAAPPKPLAVGDECQTRGGNRCEILSIFDGEGTQWAAVISVNSRDMSIFHLPDLKRAQ